MNYKKIQTIVKHQFEWEKGFLLFVISTMLVMKIIFIVFNLHSLIMAFGMALTFVPIFFIKPEFTGKETGFSAKYMFSFPLSRKELLISQIFVYLISCLPLMLWLALFYNYAASIFNFFDSSSTAVFVLLTIALAKGASTHSGLYNLARGSSLKRGIRENAFYFFLVYTSIILVTVVFLSLTYYFEQQFGINVGSILAAFSELADKIIHTKWLGIVILFFSLGIFHHIKKISSQDKFSFSKPLNMKRDLTFFGVGVTFTAACLTLAINAIPLINKGEMQLAVYKQDYKEIQKLLSSGVDINRPNVFGMTPMMVALRSGDLKLVKFLETKGANYDGEIKKIDDKFNGFDARLFAILSDSVKLIDHMKDKVPSFNNSNSLKTMHPIHVAAKYCKSKVIDYLISNGVDIEARNDRGNTPIVVAALNNCFESVISLKEAGARFDVLDIKGKLALHDLGNKASPELKMFVEKNMRAPASK